MKIYTRIIIDFDSLRTIEADSFEYAGPVAECGGGGGKSAPSVPAAPEPEPMPTAEEKKDPVSQAVRDAEQQRIRARRGLAGTILTSPLGTTGAGKTLLGT